MANIGHVDVNDLLGSEAGVDLTPVITKIDAVKADTGTISLNTDTINQNVINNSGKLNTLQEDVTVIKTNTTPPA